MLFLLLIVVLTQEPGGSAALERYDRDASGGIEEKEFVRAAEDHILGHSDRGLATTVAGLYLAAAGPSGREVACAAYDADDSGHLDANELAVAFIEYVEGFVTVEAYAMFMGCPAVPPTQPVPNAPMPSATSQPSGTPVLQRG